MKGNNPYKHITKAGYDLMDSIPTGSLLRVKWIEDPDDVDGAEWAWHENAKAFHDKCENG
jgi:hypothetical protein